MALGNKPEGCPLGAVPVAGGQGPDDLEQTHLLGGRHHPVGEDLCPAGKLAETGDRPPHGPGRDLAGRPARVPRKGLRRGPLPQGAGARMGAQVVEEQEVVLVSHGKMIIIIIAKARAFANASQKH